MAKLVVYVPEQTFEYEISESLYNDYVKAEAEGEETEDWFDAWISDADPEKTWKVVA